MPSIWSEKVVGFNPLFKDDQLLGFAICSNDNHIFYEPTANYNALLSSAKSVIVFDGYAINKLLKDFVYCKHNLRTLYYQLKSNVRFQSVRDLIKQEYYTEPDRNYSYMGNTKTLQNAKACITEASFIRRFYLENYKKIDGNTLKIDNSLLKEFSLKSNLVRVNQLAIRTDLSQFQLDQWNTERTIFHKVGHPVLTINQLSYKQQQDDELRELFNQKAKSKSKYESLLRYLDVEELNLEFDITGSSTGRIFCRDIEQRTGLFAPDKEYKHNFMARKNHTLVSADYSRQEASILAVVSDDKRLQKDLENEKFYAKLAKWALGISNKQIGKDMFYALAYGVSIKVLAEKLSVSEEKAEDIKMDLQSRYASLTKWLRKAKTLKTNYFGRRLYESTANAYTQSTAADIIRRKLLDTIHLNPICVFSDNIIYSVPDNIVNECKEEIQETLENIKPFKLSVSIKTSKDFNFI